MAAADIVARSTQATIDWARSDLDLTYQQIGQAVGADRRTIYRWVERETLPSPEHREAVEKLQELKYLLESIFRDKTAAQEWLHSPVPAFRGRSPASLLKKGKIDPVIEVLASLEVGAST